MRGGAGLAEGLRLLREEAGRRSQAPKMKGLKMRGASVAALLLAGICGVEGASGGSWWLPRQGRAVGLGSVGFGAAEKAVRCEASSRYEMSHSLLSPSLDEGGLARTGLGAGLLAFTAPVLRTSPGSERVLGLTAAACSLGQTRGWKKRRAHLSGFCLDAFSLTQSPLGPGAGSSFLEAVSGQKEGPLIARQVWVDRRPGADTGEFDDDDEEYSQLSAQEKRMMKRLREKMRLNQQLLDQEQQPRQPVFKRKASQQQKLMRKERLQEKLVLRGQEPTEVMPQRPMGFKKAPAGKGKGKDGKQGTRKVRSAYAAGVDKSVAAQKPAKPGKSRAKAKKAPPQVQEQGKPQNLAAPQQQSQMPDLSSFKKPIEIIDAVEQALDGSTDGLPGIFAVSALNKLKKLPKHSVHKSKLGGRVDHIMRSLGEIVVQDLDNLSGKHISLAVNAIAATKGGDKLMKAAAIRSIALAKDQPDSLDIQAVAVILNAYARAGIRDEILFSALSHAACRLAEASPEEFSAQSVSIIANAFSKMRIRNTPLFEHLSRVAQMINPADYGPQAVSNILNAFARLDEYDSALFNFLSKVVKETPNSSFLTHHLAITVNAYAKMEIYDAQLLKHVEKLVLARTPATFDSQAIANILNAYSRLMGESTSPKLVQHLAVALRGVNLATLDPSTMSIALNALVKIGWQDEALYRRLMVAAKVTDPLLFDGQAVSTVMHSFAKIGMDNWDLFDTMAAVAMQMQYAFNPHSISLVLNACAKAEYKNEALLAHLSKVVRKFPAEEFEAQHVDNILNAYARLEVKDRPLFVHMAHIIEQMGAASFDAQSVGVIMNAYAKIMHRDEVLNGLCAFFSEKVLPSMPIGSLNPLSISVILNSYAKAEIREENIIKMLSACIQRGGRGGPLSVDKFEIRHIASILHAYAQLNIEQDDVVDALWRQLLQFSEKDAQPEEIAVIAWSITVLNLQDLDLIEWLLKGLEHHWDHMEHSLRRQGQQFVLGCELEGLLDIKTGLLRGRKGRPGTFVGSAKRIQAAFSIDNHTPSRLQEDVAGILEEMGIDFKQEYVDQRSGYSVDMLMGDRRTAIEVDGPTHFAAGSHTPLGHTTMKHRQLEQLGFDLRILPYWEWDQLDSKEKKIQYIKNLLTATPSVSNLF